MALDSFIFGGNTGLTYEQLKRRRAVALALASQRRGFPKTVGEGLTYLGESIGDTLAERRLDAAERQSAAYGANLRRDIEGGAAAPPAAPLAIPPAAPRGPTPVRPPAAPMPPRPAPAAPISAAAPAPSINAIPVRPTPADPYGATEGTGEGFAPGDILNPAPIAAPGLQEVFPGEEGAREAGGFPSSGYLPPAVAAAPPSPAPISPTAAPSALSPEWQALNAYRESQGLPPRPPPDSAMMRPGYSSGAPAAPAAPGPQSGLQDFIAKQEGYRPTAYWDYKQYSIGHGTRGQPGETISREEAGRRLESEVANARQSVEDFAPNAPAGIKDALTSLTYNAGPGWQRAGLGRAVQEGDWEGARQRFQQYVKAGGSTLPGLVSRRNAELAQFWDQDGADTLAGGVQLAAYAPDGGAGAPIPGMGGAGAARMRPQIPPLQGPPPAPEEQVTPVDIEPAPPTAQYGPPTNRFTRSDAPVVGLPPATAIPAPGVAGPTQQAPPAPAIAPRPSQEPIPPATPQTMEPPSATPPPPPTGRPMTDTQQKILRALTDPRLDPNGPDAAALKDMFSRHEAERQRLEKIDFSDYTSKRERWEKETTEFKKFEREKTEREIKQLGERQAIEEQRQKMEEGRQKLKAGQAPTHATVNDVPVQWDQESGTWKEIKVQRLPSEGGPPSVKLTKEQSDELQHLTKVRIALDQYNRVRDADKILAEGLKDELAGRLPFFGNAALSEKYRAVRNAASNFLQGHLRSTSGAAIGAQEMATHYSSLVPLYGDDPVTIKNKQQQREGIAQGMYVGLGTARPLFDYTVQKRQEEDTAEQARLRAEMPKNPEVGKIYKNEKGRRRYWTGSRWEDD